MKRLTTSAAAIAVALALGACGGGGGSDATRSSDGAAGTLAVRQLPDVGKVLVDSGGKALYTSDQERSGTIICTGGCTTFWKPLRPDTSTPAMVPAAGKLGVIKRPDGGRQITTNGQPLYTFSEDSPGKVAGDGFTDDFEGHHFIWHVVGSSGKSGAGASSDGGTPSDGGAGQTGTDSGSGGGGYGY